MVKKDTKKSIHSKDLTPHENIKRHRLVPLPTTGKPTHHKRVKK